MTTVSELFVEEECDDLVILDPELQVGRELYTKCGVVAGVIADWEELILSLNCNIRSCREIPIELVDQPLVNGEYNKAVERFEEFDIRDISEWHFSQGRFIARWDPFCRTTRVVIAKSDSRQLAVIFTVN